MKEKTVCFSGHRPEKLPFCGDTSSPQVKMIMARLFGEIENSIESGYTTFISGMAKGVDLWAAKYITERKEALPQIRLICAVPYVGYGESWKGVDKWDFCWITDKADEIVYVCDRYYPYCMKKRNEYMIDNSSRLIAVIEDYNSGTGQTIRLAQKKGLDTIIISARKEIFI